jgi:hypothetical protein
MKIATVENPTYVPIIKYLVITHPVINGSSLNLNKFIIYFDLGGFFIMFCSGGLNPRAVAGGPSVTKLTHNN